MHGNVQLSAVWAIKYAKFFFSREKLAYIMTVNMQVPVLPTETGDDVSQVEDLLHDGRMGHQV